MNPEDLERVLNSHALWIQGKGGECANLRGADMRGANLRGADMRGANMRNANLMDADMRGANLRGADMRYVSLEGANLRGADMRGANMRNANLMDADMRGADLSDANLCETDLDHAVGNAREVKSAYFDRWSVVWTRSPDEVDFVQIGCQRHSLAQWVSFDECEIDEMDCHALRWWREYKDLIVALIETSPAKPWGKAKDDK